MFTAVAHSWGIPALESRLFTGESVMSWEALTRFIQDGDVSEKKQYK
jgi:hypothetical protein